MPISYKPLLRLLLEKDLKKTDLVRMCGLSLATVAKLAKNEPMTLDNLSKICAYFNCQFSDIVEYIPDSSTIGNTPEA